MKTEELKNSYDKYGALYPVLTDVNGNLIDGFHRKRVDPNWPEFKLPWVKTEEQRLIIGMIGNFIRREITGNEISNKLGQLAEKTGWTPKEISDVLPQSYRWVMKYIPEKYKRKYDVSRYNCAQRAELNSNISDTFFENVWYDERGRGEGGHADFHGNTPPIIVEQCLVKYTEEQDIVLDPMAGSGTTVDVCKRTNRTCEAYDLKPVRDDILYGDAETVLLNKEYDFIFSHFPYWKLVEYSDNPEDLSGLSFSQYLEKSERIIQHLVSHLAKEKFFAILIGDLRRNRRLYDLGAHFSLIASKYLTLFDKIIYIGRTLGVQHGASMTLRKWTALHNKFHLQVFDMLLIFRRDK